VLSSLFDKSCSLLLGGLLFVGAASAQIENSGFPILGMEPSARAAALAGSTVALTEANAGVLFSNPALLTPAVDGRLEFSYLNHVSDINAGWIAYGKDMDSLGTFAVGLRYLSFGSFDERNELGEKTGTFSASDVAVSIGASRPWRNRMRYGASFEIMRSSLASEAASAAALEAGAVFVDEDRRRSFGISLHHVGLVLSSVGNRSDKLPVDLRIGFTQKLAHLPLLFSVTGYRLHKLDGGPDDAGGLSRLLYHLRFAGEFQFNKAFNVRFGYDHRRHDELRVKSRLDMAGFSTGIGIVISRIGIDYAYNSWSSLGGLHRFTVVSSI